MKKIRKFVRDIDGITNIETIVAVSVVVIAFSVVFASFTAPINKEPLSKKVDLNDKALEVLNLLVSSTGETIYKQTEWQDDVAMVKTIGFKSTSQSDEDVSSDFPVIPAQDEGYNETSPKDNLPPLKPTLTTNVVKNGYTNVELGPFNAVTTDPDGDDIYYVYDWGDESYDSYGPVSSGTIVSLYHTWSNSGIYSIKVIAVDIYLAESPWSDPIAVTILNGDDEQPYNPNDDPHNKSFDPVDPDVNDCVGVCGQNEYGNCYYQMRDGECVCNCPMGHDPDAPEVPEAPAEVDAPIIQQESTTTTDANQDLSNLDDPFDAPNVGSCFLAGTQIIMADETLKNIEDIKPGDKIKAFDVESKTLKIDEIKNIFHDAPEKMSEDYYLIINNELKVTPDHLIYLNEEWIPAEKLKTGDTLGFGNKITSIEKIFQRVPTFNLDTKIYDNYLVKFGNSYLIAHNEENFTYVIGGYEERVNLIKHVTDSDFAALLSYEKIRAMYKVSPTLVREIFEIPDYINFVITVTTHQGAKLLYYTSIPGFSPENANIVASQSENVLVGQYNPNVGSYSYSFSNIEIVMFI